MNFEDFIAKWICTDVWSMMPYQGTINFNSMTCIFSFPVREENVRQIYAIPLIQFKDEDFQLALKEIDESLTAYYRLTEGN